MDNDLTKLTDLILRVLTANPSGVTQKTFEEQIPELRAEQLLMIIQQLIKSSQIEMIKAKNSKESLFKLRNAEIIALEKKLKPDERAVYERVRQADSKGISMAMLKKSARLRDADAAKLERRLVELGLARVLSFNGQKVLVAIDIAPDAMLQDKARAMGASEIQRDETRVAHMEAVIEAGLKARHEAAVSAGGRVSEQRRAAFVTLEAVVQLVRSDSASSDGAVSDKEVEAILTGLACASRVVRASHASLVKPQLSLHDDRDTDDADNADKTPASFVYRFKPRSSERAPSVAVFPCVLCPHKEYCSPGKQISPENCRYLHDFLYEF